MKDMHLLLCHFFIYNISSCNLVDVMSGENVIILELFHIGCRNPAVVEAYHSMMVMASAPLGKVHTRIVPLST